MFDHEILIINTANLAINSEILAINRQILKQNELREQESKVVVNLLKEILSELRKEK